MRNRRIFFILITIFSVVSGYLTFYYYRFVNNQNINIISRIVVSADAPYMQAGPGSVLILDTDIQESAKTAFPKIIRIFDKYKITTHQTDAFVDMPFVYLKAEYREDGSYVVLSSSFMLDHNGASRPLTETLWSLFQTLAITREHVERALTLAEESKIIDFPISLEDQ